MGLGKSVQALAAAAAYFPQSWPLLIICPSSLRFMWADAVRSWLPAEMQPAPSDLWVVSNIQEFIKVSKRGVPSGRPHVCVTSYDLVQKMEGLERQYRFIIADESHALKSPQAKRTAFVSALLQSQAHQADRRALLITGTPVLSRPIEIWSQVNMLRPQLLGTYHEFGQRYCMTPGAPTNYSNSPHAAPEYRGACRLTELNQRLTAAVMIRRQKDDVASQLPDKIRQKVPIEAEGNAVELRNISTQLQQNPIREASSTQEEERLDAIARCMGLEAEREKSKREKDALMTAYWRATGPAKMKGGVAFLNDMLDRGDVKVLVFAHHQAVLDAYEDAMHKAKVGYVRIDGSSNDAHRKSAVDAFQMQKGTRVALLSITAAAVGLTLNAAQACLFAELHWTPSLLMQAEDRAHRLGVKSSVTCYYLIAKNTADDMMWPLINSKLSVIGTLIDGRSAQGSAGMESGAGGALPSPQAAKRQRTGQTTKEERSAAPGTQHSGQVFVISDDE
uniref:Uncharacterized protein n=3 Tax=Dunaliella tertiolecta TaxID=3047 RepID=A0A7S3R7U2_DUNTE|mmetsp:Transcript_10982/g.28654  ORF Transcript_10982/g.28654 Transcript_10982/m.28654 type:complete len:504 (-) Transcript_10982:585-2096(-)